MQVPQPARILVVANRTAATPGLLEEVRTRARRGHASFHLVVPAMPRGLHRVVDPEVTGRLEAEQNLEAALPKLRAASGVEVTGEVGDSNPNAAIADAMNVIGFDEIIVSTLPARLSRWARMDLVSHARGYEVPVTHVDPDAIDACFVPRAVGRRERRSDVGRIAANGRPTPSVAAR
ncbi:MAG: universal stress protein [Solirubrobacterales bacterium]|nr:universal stress protein [Solirubrobacterales bacterium]